MNETPEQIKLEFFYDTSGAIVLTCNQCSYRNTMLSTDIMPTDSLYFLRHTVDEIYHALRHMQTHVTCNIQEPSEGPADA